MNNALMHSRDVEIVAKEAEKAARRAGQLNEIVQKSYETMQRLILLFGRTGMNRS